ncbi:MAG: hypothetical protein WAM40_11100 [Xanthobacteraceae bacterium]
MAERIGIVAPDLERAIEARQRFVEPLQLRQHIAPVQKRFGIVRLDGKRSVVTCQRLVEPLQRRKGQTAMIQSKTVVGIFCENKIYLIKRPRKFAALISNDAEQMPAVGMIGLHRENFR